jgi:putative ABC transport system permease protein
MHWLPRLFRKQQAEKQLDAELRDHLDRQISDYIASGMSHQEARRRAHLDFGGIESVKQQTRESLRGNLLETLFLDLRYAIRNLRKDRRFATVAILALALGIGASTVVFSIFYNLFFNAFAAKDASRLVVPVIQNTENTGQADSNVESLTLHLADLDVIREQNQVFENITGYITAGGIVLANDGAQMYQFYDARVTSDAFDFYGVPPLLGRGIAPEDGKPGAPPVFVMSYKTWNGVFHADPKILGKALTIDGEPRTLVGIMPARFQAYGSQTQVWIPITRSRDTPRADGEFPAEVLARLKPGVTTETASADLEVIVKRLALLHPDDFPKHFTARVLSAADFFMRPQKGWTLVTADVKHLLYDMLAAVAMLLLIACSNVANLLLARATVREKEMAVRSALGATRGRLVRQLLAESSVLAVAACAVGCLFAWFGTKFISAIIPRTGDIASGGHIGGETGLGLNPPVLFFALGLTLLTTLICGLAPALHVMRTDLQPQLAGTGKGTGGAFRHGKLRAGLVVAEVAFSIVLLIGAGLMMRSFFVLTRVDLGFNPKNVLLLYFMPPPSHDRTSSSQRFTSPQGRAVLLGVVERLKALPGVTDVSIEDALPGYSPGRGYQVAVPGATHSEEAGLIACDDNFLQTLELRLIQGRWLSETEVRTAQYAGVINQRLARELFGDASPIGQQVRVKAFKSITQPPQDSDFQIVGVVADMKNAGPQQPAIPMIYLPYTVRGGPALLLKTTVDPASLRNAVQEQIWAVNRDEIIGLASPLEDFLQRFAYSTPEFGLLICTPLASIALMLVVIGVFSVMAYTVSLQTQEIGIRMALGAQQSSILQMILTKGARLLAIGILLGLFASYGLTRFLASQIWGVSATDPWTFTAVAVFVVAVGLGACFLPARRATQVDPLVALRYE